MMMQTHDPAFYRDLLQNLMESIELEEARIDTLRQMYVPKLDKAINSIQIPQEVKSQLDKIQGESPGEVLFNWIAEQDPGKNNPATQWMLDRVLRKDNPIPLEDLLYAKETLAKFLTAVQKRTLPADVSNDINKYKSLSDIEAALQSGEKAATDIASKDLKAATEQSIIHYDGPDLLVLTPRTQLAADFWGQPTSWCTAWGDHKELGLSQQGRFPTRTNMFDNYNNSGPLYIIINKADPNERYQLSYAREQYMDRDDRPFEPKTLGDKFPKLWKIFTPIAEKYHSLVLNGNPSEETQVAVIKKNPRQIKQMKNPSPKIQMAAATAYPLAATLIDNPIKEVQLIAVKNDGEALVQIAKNLGHDPDEDVQLAAVKNNGLVTVSIKNPSEAVQLAAVQENGDAIRYIIRNLGKLPSIAVQKAAVANAPDALEWIEKPDREVQLYAINTHKDNQWALTTIADILATKGTDPAAAKLLSQLNA